MKIGSRVRIVSGMGEFVGKRGRVIGNERDGRVLMNRVRFDVPVRVEGVGAVEDDLWSNEHLRAVKEG